MPLQFTRISGKFLPSMSACTTESMWFWKLFAKSLWISTFQHVWLQPSRTIMAFSLLLSKSSVSYCQTLSWNHPGHWASRKFSLAFLPWKGDLDVSDDSHWNVNLLFPVPWIWEECNEHFICSSELQHTLSWGYILLEDSTWYLDGLSRCWSSPPINGSVCACAVYF